MQQPWKAAGDHCVLHLLLPDNYCICVTLQQDLVPAMPAMSVETLPSGLEDRS